MDMILFANCVLKCNMPIGFLCQQWKKRVNYCIREKVIYQNEYSNILTLVCYVVRESLVKVSNYPTIYLREGEQQ